eukprot:CAMPEP_0181194536 /NCGR_PEP_ID=MMETSP1096-20121128/14392_1 /TAXON_ID=156174 ORGANISM="Chrysochromulina ericina, Strain CCMP281" /NCGR_SAMPLE_ID=MMETSP1096 /ASSEMBLY_ACC=CAM_ASM_000453 /LENGTH=101 /DNA_ID=CAMNT_0023284051 /DNA_START=222 /DNA_END=527 /DNA_ORIENTATION=+
MAVSSDLTRARRLKSVGNLGNQRACQRAEQQTYRREQANAHAAFLRWQTGGKQRPTGRGTCKVSSCIAIDATSARSNSNDTERRSASRHSVTRSQQQQTLD